ncbi:hypothetical protein QR680_016988 [Steinernema hermaphroditum]|uniref:Mitochondrial fission 1 protein n=1 Tax=Steinernema hermaphroditum TaxID=289476 RepID=A0AA39LNB8_9BILA|nr:hypothetical protein QR680_016988 [Steinernema hermaphroditum]
MDCIVDEVVDPNDLEMFRRVYAEQLKRGQPSAVAVFQFAHALIRSNRRDVQMGIELLEGLLRRDTEDIPKRDYVYFLAIAHTRAKDYDKALSYVDILLHAENQNRQATELKALIEKRMKKDGIMGMAILGGGAAAVVGGVLVAALLSKK